MRSRCLFSRSWTDPSRSVVVQVSHYSSWLLSGFGMCHGWTSSGWFNFETCHQQQPELVHEVRRPAVAGAAWLFVRLIWRLNRMPWLVAVIADARRAMSERMAVADNLFGMDEHDLDPGFARHLRRRLDRKATLFTKKWLDLIYLWARSHRVHSQAAENRHAANAKVLSSCTDYLHFVSRCANQEQQQRNGLLSRGFWTGSIRMTLFRAFQAVVRLPRLPTVRACPTHSPSQASTRCRPLTWATTQLMANH